jgi:hypothetical protein
VTATSTPTSAPGTFVTVPTLAAGGTTALARRDGGRAGAGEHVTAHGRP